MFTRLFKPRWEHPDPRIRCQAFEAGGVPAEVLAKAAREDEDAAVRRCAVERLGDPELLAALLAAEPLAELREAAGRRLREILAGPLPGEAPLPARLAAMACTASPELCTFLAREAQAAEIRTAALERIEDIAVLCEVAVSDSVATVRRAALERIGDPQGWEVVARDARNKDKQISRLARERLEAHRKRQAEEEMAQRLCAELEALAAATPGPGGRLQLLRIIGQWDRLETPPAAPLKERFARGRERVEAAIEHYRSSLNERQELCEGLDGLLASLKGSAAGSDVRFMPQVKERVRQASERWRELVPPLADDDPLARRFTELARQIEGEAERLVIDEARSAPLLALLQEVADLLGDTDALDERRVADLERRWQALDQPASTGRAEALQQEFAARCERMRERLEQQAEQRRQALEEAQGIIAGLADLLGKGELERALSQRDRARHLLKIAAGSDERKRAALQARLQRLHPRFEDLRQWRHWGSGNARERLCEEIETLVDSVLPAAEIAARVRTGRESWKRIDRAEGPAPEALWQRFDQACTRAYAPYQQERSEQTQRLAAHLAQKQALCRELDAFERDTDWKTVDWRAADRRVRSAAERWRRIGPVPAKARKSLEKEYQEVLARLASHLDAERERELRRRRTLIARVEQLAAAPDRRSAILEVKEAQKLWLPTVGAAPEVEQSLWNAFRSACEAVLSLAKEERLAADSERQANFDRKSALCAELEALLERAAADFHDLTQRFAAAGAEWERIGAVPHKLERALDARFAALKTRYAERREQVAKAAAQALLQGLRERDRLCERLESAVLENTLAEAERDALVGDTRRAWDALTPLEGPQARGLEQRFALASRALAGEAGARDEMLDALPRNLAWRQELCLQMEIAAGLDSPAEFGEARLRLRVSRLADALSHRQEGVRDGSAQLRELLRDWYQAGPAPLAAREGLAARLARILAVAG